MARSISFFQSIFTLKINLYNILSLGKSMFDVHKSSKRAATAKQPHDRLSLYLSSLFFHLELRFFGRQGAQGIDCMVLEFLIAGSRKVKLNIEKLDGNIVQKHGGSKQVGFKQLGPSVETGVHGVHDKNRVWFEVELQGAQGSRKAEVFQNKEQKKGWWTSVKQDRAKDQDGSRMDCKEMSRDTLAKYVDILIQYGISKVFWAEDTTRSTYLVNRSPSSAIGFKKPIDMLGFFGWLASIKQGMLEPVKVKCIFLGYHKSIVGNKLWRLDDVTSKVVLYRNMGFNESGEYKKTFIGSGVGTGSMQVLHGFEFEVEPLGDHTFEVEPQENVDQGAGLQEVQTQDLMDYQLARDRDQHLACELFGYREDSNEAAFAVAAVEKIYAHESLTSIIQLLVRKCSDDNDGYYLEYTPGMFIHLFLYIDDMVFSCGCTAEIWATKGLLDKAKGNVLGMEIVRDHSGNTLRVLQSRFYNGKLVQTLLEGHSILSLEGSLSRDCEVEKNDVGMFDKFDRGLKTDVQVFVDFDYDMGRSITHMEAMSTTEVGYMTFTEAWKKEI
ncbi:hypothetical protein Tco_0482362 [Tanacetum coccineum]